MCIRDRSKPDNELPVTPMMEAFEAAYKKRRTKNGKRARETQAVHGWLSTYERLVNSQNFFSPYLTQEDLSRLGRTNFLSNAVIVCRIDDLGRFVTRGQRAHSHPRGGNRPHYFELESLSGL